jgi:hypothetical protein
MASFGMVILLLAQDVLGVAYNLYGTAPTATKSVKVFSSPLLGAHVILGTLLFLLSIVVVVTSIRARERVATIASTVGVISIFAAGANGSAFAQDGASEHSMAMAVLTAVAVLCYTTIMSALSLRNGARLRPHPERARHGGHAPVGRGSGTGDM